MIETKEIKVRRTEESVKNLVEFHIRNSTSPWLMSGKPCPNKHVYMRIEI